MRAFRTHWIDFRDVSFEFAVCALIIGAALLIASSRPMHGERSIRLLLVFISLAFVLLVDRGLLVHWGRSPWITDPTMHYRHRPSTQHSFNYWYRGHQGTTLHTPRGVVHINRYGQHDDDFAAMPPTGEWRGLIIGDSVTMGHGVEKDKTYSNQLEDLLGEFDARDRSHQIINAGVQGYNTEQEYHMLAQTLDLRPSFVIVGFCYNDVPLGDAQQTYKHNEVRKYDAWLRYALTETGIGLSIQKFRQYRFSSQSDTITEDNRHRQRSLLRDPTQRHAASGQLNKVMRKIYTISQQHDADVILLIIPAMEQLFQPELQAFHSDLTRFAKRNNAGYIDLTPFFEREIGLKVNKALSERPRATPDAATIDALRVFEARKFYIDDIHLTQRGHRLAAEAVALFLNRKYDLNFDSTSFARASSKETARMDSIFSSFILPTDYQSALQTGRALEFLGNQNMAVDIYERALSSSAQAGARSELHYMIGKMRNALGQRDVAVAHLRHSIFNLQSADWPIVGPNAYNQLGLDLLLMDLSDEAIIAFAKTLAVKPDNRDAHIGLGRAFYQIGDFASAINAYSAARQAGTTCIVEFNMGLAHLGLGDTTRAMKIYTQAIDSCGGRHGPIGQAVADLQKLRATGVATEAVTTIIEMLDGNQP